MFQGSPNEVIRNRRAARASTPSELDAILVTHAHLDHCGYLPVVVREGFTGPIYLTSATAELVEIVLLDSGRLQEEFAKRHSRWERRHPDEAVAADAKDAAKYRAAVEEARQADGRGPRPDLGRAGRRRRRATPRPSRPRPNRRPATETAPGMADPEARRCAPSRRSSRSTSTTPLYNEADAEAVPAAVPEVRYGREVEVAPGVTATFVDAGHILGSAIIGSWSASRTAATPTTIVFSGDLGRPGTPIIRDPTPMTEADYVIVESTYGGREHEPGDEAVRMLAEAVRAVDDAGGVLLIPSFAIGRTQEIVWELDRLIERGEIPELPLYLDSPMASRASDVYRRHPEFYDEETSEAPCERQHAARLPEPDHHPDGGRVEGDRARATGRT